MEAIDMRSAALKVVCSKGPWQVEVGTVPGTWKPDVRTLTGDQLQAFYDAVPDPVAMSAAVGGSGLSDRRCDRFLQVLRRARLIEFDKAARAWKKV